MGNNSSTATATITTKPFAINNVPNDSSSIGVIEMMMKKRQSDSAMNNDRFKLSNDFDDNQRQQQRTFQNMDCHRKQQESHNPFHNHHHHHHRSTSIISPSSSTSSSSSGLAATSLSSSSSTSSQKFNSSIEIQSEEANDEMEKKNNDDNNVMIGIIENDNHSNNCNTNNHNNVVFKFRSKKIAQFSDEVKIKNQNQVALSSQSSRSSSTSTSSMFDFEFRKKTSKTNLIERKSRKSFEVKQDTNKRNDRDNFISNNIVDCGDNQTTIVSSDEDDCLFDGNDSMVQSIESSTSPSFILSYYKNTHYTNDEHYRNRSSSSPISSTSSSSSASTSFVRNIDNNNDGNDQEHGTWKSRAENSSMETIVIHSERDDLDDGEVRNGEDNDDECRKKFEWKKYSPKKPNGIRLPMPLPRSKSFHQILRSTKNGKILASNGTIRGSKPIQTKSIACKDHDECGDVDHNNDLSEFERIIRLKSALINQRHQKESETTKLSGGEKILKTEKDNQEHESVRSYANRFRFDANGRDLKENQTSDNHRVEERTGFDGQNPQHEQSEQLLPTYQYGSSSSSPSSVSPASTNFSASTMSIAMANTNNNNNNLMGVAGKIQRLKQRQQQQNEILMMAADGRNCESLKRFGKIDPQQQSNLSQNHQDRFKARSDGQESAIKIKRSLSNFDSTFFRSHSNRIESVREQVEQTKSSTNLFWPIDDHHNLLQQHQQQANHHPCLWDLRNGKIDRVSINNGIDNPWRLKRPDYRCDGSSRNSDISTSASGSRMHLSFEILNEQIHNRLQNEMLGMKFGSITVTERSLNSNYDSNGDCLKRKESDGLVADVLNITNESNNIERKSPKSKQKKFNIIDPYDRHYRPGGGFDQNFILKRLTPTAGLNENDPFQQFNWKTIYDRHLQSQSNFNFFGGRKDSYTTLSSSSSTLSRSSLLSSATSSTLTSSSSSSIFGSITTLRKISGKSYTLRNRTKITGTPTALSLLDKQLEMIVNILNGSIWQPEDCDSLSMRNDLNTFRYNCEDGRNNQDSLWDESKSKFNLLEQKNQTKACGTNAKRRRKRRKRIEYDRNQWIPLNDLSSNDDDDDEDDYDDDDDDDDPIIESDCDHLESFEINDEENEIEIQFKKMDDLISFHRSIAMNIDTDIDPQDQQDWDILFQEATVPNFFENFLDKNPDNRGLNTKIINNRNGDDEISSNSLVNGTQSFETKPLVVMDFLRKNSSTNPKSEQSQDYHQQQQQQQQLANDGHATNDYYCSKPLIPNPHQMTSLNETCFTISNQLKTLLQNSNRFRNYYLY